MKRVINIELICFCSQLCSLTKSSTGIFLLSPMTSVTLWQIQPHFCSLRWRQISVPFNMANEKQAFQKPLADIWIVLLAIRHTLSKNILFRSLGQQIFHPLGHTHLLLHPHTACFYINKTFLVLPHMSDCKQLQPEAQPFRQSSEQLPGYATLF